jgi:tRNA pseudouridine38-40 synthase
VRIAIGVEYDGRGFCGFQTQPAGCGVQDALQRSLASIAGETIAVTAAGRTDAGVHATQQVVHFDAPSARPLSAWVRGVNTHLPPAAAVVWSRVVPADFHARFSATARHYTYLLLNRPERPGLSAGRVGWYHRPLEVAAMRAAAQSLLGEHDFSSFRAAECQAATPVRRLLRAEVTASGGLIRFEFTANAFLHHMIRNLVGALVAVGSSRHDPAWLVALLAARDRTRAPATFAPDGLYFAGADYPASFGLPAGRVEPTLPA